MRVAISVAGALSMLALPLLACHLPGFSPGTSTAGSPLVPPGATPLVAEGWLRTDPSSDGSRQFFYLPITLQGHQVSVILDMGSSFPLILSVSPEALAHAGIRGSVDSLTIGSHTEPVVVTPWDMDGNTDVTPPGLPQVVGIIGPQLLAHYDLLFNTPAAWVRLYASPPAVVPPAPSAGQPVVASDPSLGPRREWLPAGLTSADCTPLRQKQGDTTDQGVSVDVQVDGHPVPGFFDSGSDHIVMNAAAAKLVGITKQTPHLRRIPADSMDTYGNGVAPTWEYEMPAVPLSLGRRRLSVPALRVIARLTPFGEETPQILLGKDAVRDRLFLVSYSTRQVCLSAPLRRHPSHS